MDERQPRAASLNILLIIFIAAMLGFAWVGGLHPGPSVLYMSMFGIVAVMVALLWAMSIFKKRSRERVESQQHSKITARWGTGKSHQLTVIYHSSWRAAYNAWLQAPDHKRASPPRLAKFILLLLAPSKDREPLLGDIEEAYRTIVLPEYGPRAAWFWYWRQVCTSIWPLLRVWLRGIIGMILLWKGVHLQGTGMSTQAAQQGSGTAQVIFCGEGSSVQARPTGHHATARVGKATAIVTHP